jgi:hypothetical protein
VYFLAGGHANFTRLSDEGLISREVYDLALEPYGEGRLCAVTEDGIYYYNETWEKEDISGCYGDPRSIAFDLDPVNSTWLATDKSVYRSIDAALPVEGVAIESLNILSYFNYEPTIREVQEKAIEYAEVHPYKIAGWRTRANLSALMPRLSLGLDQDEDDTYEIYTSSSKQYSYLGPKKRSNSWDLTFTWDLADMVWNSDQTLIDVRSKLMVQLRDDILDEVTSYYFERRRLQTELLCAPPAESRTKIRKELRLQELTANIDGMTGGYFSNEIESRK